MSVGVRKPVSVGLVVLCVLIVVLLASSAPVSAAKIHQLTASFGEPGAEPGKFSGPSGVAVEEVALAEAGDVYVVDKGGNRVERFDAEGVFEGEFTGAATPAKAFSGPEGIAIDNSANPLDPSPGDVYVVDRGNKVVDKFSPEGAYLGQITEGAGGAPLGEILGVAVDAEGSVWVYQESKEIDDYTNGEPNVFVASREMPFGTSAGFAVDRQDDFYANRGSEEMAKFNSAGEVLIEAMNVKEGETASGAAVDLSSNDTYVATNSEGAWSVAEFDEAAGCTSQGSCSHPPSDALIERFGSGVIVQGGGIAVNASTGSVYVADRGTDQVRIFASVASVPLPTVTTGVASNAHLETATLHGIVNPEGEALTQCKFEYGTTGSYGEEAPCAQSVGEIGSGSSPVPVSADLKGLNPRTVYHYRLVATNAFGSTKGEDRTLFTTSAPVVEDESTTSIGVTEAALTAKVDAAGVATSYRVEFGTTSSYGKSTAEVSLGAARSPVGAPAHLTELTPSTTYHFRYVAVNELKEEVAGEDKTFATAPPGTGITGAEGCPNRTFAGFSASLPDCRAYELVSSDSPGEVYVPKDHALAGREEDIPTSLPMQASSAGDVAAYVGDPGTAGGTGSVGAGLGDEFIARRGDNGHWLVQTVTPQSAVEDETTAPEFSAFSADLSTGVFTAIPSVANYLSSIASPGGPPDCFVLYSRDSGGYHALFTETMQPGSCGQTEGFSQQSLLFAGGNDGTTSGDRFRDLLFQSPAALSPSAEPVVEEGAGNNLYESIGGSVHLVNVLPKGESVPDAVFGGPATASKFNSYPDFDHAISADGSRIFWTDLDRTSGPENPAGLTRLLAREDPSSPAATTVQLDVPAGGSGAPGGGRFWIASGDGSKILFTDESKLTPDSTAEPGMPNLYLYDFGRPPSARLSDLTPVAGAGVQGVIGASNDGSYVYFVAEGVLAANRNSEQATAEPRACEEAEGNLQQGTPSEEEARGHLPAGIGCNLYVVHDGETRFIATLARKDDNFESKRVAQGVTVGDWQPELGSRTAQVTPDGRGLVFESTQQLTGYDNSNLIEFIGGDEILHPEHTVEIFTYDVASGASGTLRCASCAPSGERPVREGSGVGAGTFLPVTASPVSVRRWISADGTRVFFDSSQPLVSQDSNGLQDVYEWEREGTSGCPAATSSSGGCVFLLSGGQSSDGSFFVDADVTGDNVFFTHRGRLAQVGAPEGKTDLFDARVGGGFPESSLACTGTGCQGVPPAPPRFATPSSETFSGPGNFPPPASRAIKSRPGKKSVKCRKGFTRKHGKCVRAKKHAKRARRPATPTGGRKS
jgi:hypothetical protein